MKPYLEDIKSQKGIDSFYAYQFQIPGFEFKWHFHPEYELTYILKGKGFRLIGNNYESFEDGDLVLLGPNLPHTWIGKATNGKNFEALVIQFSKDFIKPVLAYKECESISDLLAESNLGLLFMDENKLIKNKLEILVNLSGLDRFLSLISILNDLSNCQNRSLSSKDYKSNSIKENEIRINKVCQFLENNFSQKLNLSKVSGLIPMTETNFCKFFKKATGKTYSDYLNEIRIENACVLLLQTEKSITDIAYDSGFETLSYFNRIFLKKRMMTPRTFRILNEF